MKINLDIKQKIYLASGFLIILIILLIDLGVKPLLGEIKETSSLVGESQKKLILLQGADQSYLRQLESEYDEIKSDIFLVNSGFLEIDQAVDFIVELETFASSTSNILEVQKVDYPAFNLQLVGSFADLMRYLGWLENGKYFININSIQVKGISEKTLPSDGAASVGDVRTTLEVQSQTNVLDYE